MKCAVIGSRSIVIDNIGEYIPPEADEIVSGGAVGVDSAAAEYAAAHGIKLSVFLPDYKKYGRAAPIVRNKTIVDYSDIVIALWDGKSRGTSQVIEYCRHTGACVKVILLNSKE